MSNWHYDPPKDFGIPRTGRMLAATPALVGSFFHKALILLCEHDSDGTFGLVLNSRLPFTLQDAVTGLRGWDVPLYCGGPVQPNTLHFVHRTPGSGVRSQSLSDGMFWGGSFDEMVEQVNLGRVKPDDIRCMVGYAGWTGGQLDDEIKEESWFVVDGSAKLVFDTESGNQWAGAMHALGPNHAIYANFPDDPRCN